MVSAQRKPSLDGPSPGKIHGCFRHGGLADCCQLACKEARLISQSLRVPCSQLKDATGKPLMDWFWVGLVSQPRVPTGGAGALLEGKDCGLHENITLWASSEGQVQLRVEKMMQKEEFSSGTKKLLSRSRRGFARARLNLTILMFIEEFLKLKLMESWQEREITDFRMMHALGVKMLWIFLMLK